MHIIKQHKLKKNPENAGNSIYIFKKEEVFLKKH